MTLVQLEDKGHVADFSSVPIYRGAPRVFVLSNPSLAPFRRSVVTFQGTL